VAGLHGAGAISGGFKDVETPVVYKEQEAPYCETLLGTGEK
jgi:hypothetical protein